MLCLLQRLFPGRKFGWLLWGVGTVVTAYTITQFMCVLLQCVPVEAIWNPKVTGHCIPLDNVFIVCSSFNIATDFTILVLPMPQLWKLKITAKQKVQLTLLFLLGGL